MQKAAGSCAATVRLPGKPARPEGAQITRGKWWPADYSGPPLMSITEDLARDYNLTVGDSVTLNILGREVTAQIANARNVDWQSFPDQFCLYHVAWPA